MVLCTCHLLGGYLRCRCSGRPLHCESTLCELYGSAFCVGKGTHVDGSPYASHVWKDLDFCGIHHTVSPHVHFAGTPDVVTSDNEYNVAVTGCDIAWFYACNFGGSEIPV